MPARCSVPSRCLLTCLFLLLSACTRREAPVIEGIRTQTLLLGNAAEPADLDPHLASILSDQMIVIALFEGLTLLDERTTQPLPAAAESWRTSADGLTWTFRLREGLTWSNGDPLTADDFVRSWRRILDPKFAAENAWYLFALKNAEAFNSGRITDPTALGFQAPDPRRLVLNLERPTPYLAALVSMPAWFPVNPRVLAKFGAMETRSTPWTRPGNLVGNGAFMLEEWRPNARIVLARNPAFRDAVHNRLEKLIFFPIDNPDVEERNFRSGQLHVTFTLPTTKLAPWRAEHPEQLRVDPTLQSNFLRFNTTRPALKDARVRRALSLAIDRELLARAVLQGSREPAASLTPPGTGGYRSRATVPTDLAAARELLAAAGYPGGAGIPVLALQCRNDEIMPRLAEALQARWEKELGVRVTVSPFEQKTWIQNQQSLDYDISTGAWTADFPDPVTFLGMFTANSAYNWTGWNDPEYERLMAAAERTAEASPRFEYLQQAEARLLEQSPIAPLHYGAQTYLIHPAVKGWEPAPLVFRRYHRVSLEAP